MQMKKQRDTSFLSIPLIYILKVGSILSWMRGKGAGGTVQLSDSWWAYELLQTLGKADSFCESLEHACHVWSPVLQKTKTQHIRICV